MRAVLALGEKGLKTVRTEVRKLVIIFAGWRSSLEGAGAGSGNLGARDW